MSVNLGEIIADPQREWSAPVSVSGDIPVLCIADPVCKPLLLYESRYPVGQHY